MSDGDDALHFVSRSQEEVSSNLEAAVRILVYTWWQIEETLDPNFTVSRELLADGMADAMVPTILELLDEGMSAVAKISALREFMRFRHDPLTRQYAEALDAILAPFLLVGEGDANPN